MSSECIYRYTCIKATTGHNIHVNYKPSCVYTSWTCTCTTKYYGFTLMHTIHVVTVYVHVYMYIHVPSKYLPQCSQVWLLYTSPHSPPQHGWKPPVPVLLHSMYSIHLLISQELTIIRGRRGRITYLYVDITVPRLLLRLPPCTCKIYSVNNIFNFNLSMNEKTGRSTYTLYILHY